VRLRFTIRDLLWLTLVVALMVGWWIDHRHRNWVQIGIIENVRLDAKGVGTLQQIFAGQTDVRILFDAQSTCLIIVAPADQVEQIQATAKSLEPIGG
jgi:hypothetical protein